MLRPKGAGRGKQPRVVGLGRRVVDALHAWLELRGDGDGPLFCTGTGRPLATAYMRQLLPRLAREAGIEKRCHPHILRHTFAFEAVMEGQPLPWISKALGHASLIITQSYLDHLAPADVIEGMQERD